MNVVTWCGAEYDTDEQAVAEHTDCAECAHAATVAGRTAVTLRIENYYGDDPIITTAQATVPPPPWGDSDAFEDWAMDWLFPHTGTGREDGDATYVVTVTASSDPALVGLSHDFA